jgi:hypothetical protein
MPEQEDEHGYIWIQELRYDDYYYLKDFDNLVVTKVTDYNDSLPKEHWEAIVYEDDSCSKVLGREIFKTKQEAQESLERYKEIALKNRGGDLK